MDGERARRAIPIRTPGARRPLLPAPPHPGQPAALSRPCVAARRAAPLTEGAGTSCDAPSAREDAAKAVEQQWQLVQALEQGREDAESIRQLQASLEALIQDKKKLHEELLWHKQRAALAAVASSKQSLVEQIATLQGELAEARRVAKKERAAADEHQASAFNAVIRQLADELQQVTTQRDEAWAKLAKRDKGFAREQAAAAAAMPPASAAHPSVALHVRESAKPARKGLFRTAAGT